MTNQKNICGIDAKFASWSQVRSKRRAAVRFMSSVKDKGSQAIDVARLLGWTQACGERAHEQDAHSWFQKFPK
jgi:hypothetical protein